MTRQPHDQFAKTLLADFLDPLGKVEVSLEVRDEPRSVDLSFDPDPAQDSRSLGLLGRIAKTLCLIEPFRNGIQSRDIQNCLLKALMVRAQRERNQQSLPHLWILTPTCSKAVLEGMKAASDPDWPKGVYFLAKHLKSGIIVIHQLPRDRDTLWIRLLGRGRVQKRAIAEVMELQESQQKLTILELLGNWKIMLDQKQEQLREEERELIMNLSPAYLEWREKTLSEGEQRGIQIGQQQGIQQVARNLLQAGMDPDQISHLTGLSLEVIQHLQHTGSNP